MNYCSGVRVQWSHHELLLSRQGTCVTTTRYFGDIGTLVSLLYLIVVSLLLLFWWIVLCNNTISRKGTCCKIHENKYLLKR